MRVVRDQHDRALELVQRLHQRLARLDVEVVGRLVEQQEMRRLAADAGEDEPRFLAAGQAGDPDLRLLLREAEAAEMRSRQEERRVGPECVSSLRLSWSHYK